MAIGFSLRLFVLIAEKQPSFFDRLNEGWTMLEVSGVRYSSFCNARVWITKSASHFFNASVMLKWNHKLTTRLAWRELNALSRDA